MKIGVIGLGHVGLVTAACFAHVGHEIVGVDADRERIEDLRHGKLPFFEPQLQEVMDGLPDGSLRFEFDLPDAVQGSEVLFICVGTPSAPSGEADLSQIEGLAVQIATLMDENYTVLVEKSTVPVRTANRVARTMRRLTSRPFDVGSNPEFLREGSAVHDTLNPDRIVIGSPNDAATELMMKAYQPIVDRTGCPVLVTDVSTAELIKHASNAFLATKISFINAIAEVCEEAGADVEVVARGMGLDSRINEQFLKAGVGYGGSCFPKDVAAFAALTESVTGKAPLLRAVQEINEAAPGRLLGKLRDELWYLKGKRIAVLGLSFKPGTDDLREAPSLKVIPALLKEHASVVAYDPVAMPKAKELLPATVSYGATIEEALQGADAAVILTDWDDFKAVDPSTYKRTLRFPIVVDGRNLYDLDDMRNAGVTYLSVGREAVRP